jgi:hypothetical protein
MRMDRRRFLTGEHRDGLGTDTRAYTRPGSGQAGQDRVQRCPPPVRTPSAPASTQAPNYALWAEQVNAKAGSW